MATRSPNIVSLAKIRSNDFRANKQANGSCFGFIYPQGPRGLKKKKNRRKKNDKSGLKIKGFFFFSNGKIKHFRSIAIVLKLSKTRGKRSLNGISLLIILLLSESRSSIQFF